MATSKGSKRKQCGYITGDKGINRVRLFAHPRNGTLMLEYRDEVGAKKRLSLGHADVTRGKIAANELAADLLKHEGPRTGELTLRTLFDNYERGVTPNKVPEAQAHDRRARKLFEACWGNAKVKNLDRRDWDYFIQQRRLGALRPVGDKRKVNGVRNRVIEHDLRYLTAACNWAETVRVNGEPMLDRNPFRGFPVPVEENPQRPILTAPEFADLAAAAKAMGPEIELYVLLVHETGHRCTAVGRLRWSDINFEKSGVTWRAEHDKMRREHLVPLTPKALDALKAARRNAARIGDGWIFPFPSNAEEPISRRLLGQLWRQLEHAAGLARVSGRGWHSLRRKFATDLKHDTPLADLCLLGGWKDAQTVLKCYTLPDEDTMRAALARRTERLAANQ